MKANQVRLVARAMLRDREQVLHAVETRFPRQITRNPSQSDRLDRLDDDVPVVHAVAPAGFHMRMLPDADAAPDDAAPDSLAKTFREYHLMVARSARL